MRSETPVFRPSAEEWRDPLAYIAYIRQNGAEEAGMAKIIPPEGWNSSFAIDRRRLKLPTKLVSVHMLAAKETSAAVLQHFWDAYNAFMVSSGFSRLKKTPTFMGQEIDLYRLFRLVSKRGGYAAVSDDKGGWRDVVLAMQVSCDKKFMFFRGKDSSFVSLSHAYHPGFCRLLTILISLFTLA